MRKIISVLVVLILLIVAGYFIYSLNDKQERTNKFDGISAIPQNAALIVRVNNPIEKWETLKESEFGKNLLQITEIKAIDSTLLRFNAMLNQYEVFKSLKEGKPLYCSLHMTGVTSFNTLFTAEVTPSLTKEFSQALNEEFKSSIKVIRQFEEVEITNYKENETDAGFSYCVNDNLLIMSNSSILLEDAILQMKHRTPLSERKEFEKLFKTADLSLDANVFVNYNEIGNLINIYGSSQLNSDRYFEHFGGWMEMDLKIGNDGLILNGLSLLNDSIPSFLSTMNKVEAVKMDVSSVIPDNIAALKFMGFNDYKKMLKEQKKLLQEKQELYQFEKNIEGLNKSQKIDVNQDIYSWIGNEFCMFITQSEVENPLTNACFAIHCLNVESAEKSLHKIAQNNPSGDTAEFMNYKINNLGLVNFLPVTLGSFFKNAKHSYYTIIQDYVIFGNDISNLKNVINSYLLGKTLVKNLDFKTYYENFQSESSYFTYLNPKKSGNFWKYFLNPVLANILIENQNIVNNIQGFGFQTVTNDQLHYTNIYTNYKVIEKDQSVSLMECILDTSYSSAPWIVRNHYTQENEILLQDDKNTLYLINNVGVILWKRKMDHKIIGDVHMVDCYRNNKIQYLFGTGKELILLDRKGHHVDGFPVKLKSTLTKGIAVLDYDNNRNYRILVPCGKKLYNYGIDGKLIKGWEFKGSKTNIACTPQLIQVAKKDYIVFSDESGNAYATGRRGETRINFNNSLPEKRKNYEIIAMANLQNSGIITTDTNGTVYFLNLSDNIETITTRNFTSNHTFSLRHVNNDNVKDIVYQDENEIYAYKLSKNQIFKISNLDFHITGKIFSYLLPSNEHLLAFCQKSNNKVYVFNDQGKLMENFPMDGSSEPKIADLNKDGKMELLIGTKTGSLFIYSLFN